MARFWKKLFGDRGERAAARHLRRQGYRILATQHTNRFGEVDLIALDGECIVFVEVKSRRSGESGHPALAVDHRKQQKLTNVALAYLKRRKLLEHRARFDIVTVVWPDDRRQPQIEHFKYAFEAIGEGQMFS